MASGQIVILLVSVVGLLVGATAWAWRRAERGLRQTTEELDRFFSTTLDLLCIADTSGRFRRVNPRWETVLGYPPGELDGARFLELVHPDDLRATQEAVARLEHQEPVLNFVNRYRCRDGSYRWLEWRSSPRGDLIYAAARDITERRLAEQSLARERAFTEAVLDSVPGLLYVYDEQGRLVRWNKQHETMTGYSAEELAAMGLFDWYRGYPEEAERIANAVARIPIEGHAEEEAQLVTKSGERIPFYLTAVSMRVDDANYFVGIGIDITERRRVEHERQVLQEQLVQAQKMESIGRLAGGVAHDFNNMIQSILGNAALVLDELPSDSPSRHGVEEIQDAALRSAELTRQLLGFARKQAIAPRVIDLNHAVAGMLKMIARLIGEGIRLKWVPGADLWPVRIDSSQLYQVLANLCVNARDAMKGSGRVTIESTTVTLDEGIAAFHPEGAPGDYVMLAVSDTGCGMDAATKAHLFEPFFTTKGVGYGTGLGLATVFGIVKQNGGLISVYSEPGTGTSFKVYLPRSTEAAVDRLPGPPPPVLHGTETILVVEDEPQVLRLSRRVLLKHGYHVLTASGPGEALAVSSEHSGTIHLMLSDVVMPGSNGRQLLAELRSHARRSGACSCPGTPRT